MTPITFDETARGTMNGRGDDIRGLFTPTKTRAAYRFTHQGKSNFAVFLICDTHDDLLVNEIGLFTGEAMVSFDDAQKCVWDITADGSWTIEPK